MNKQELIDAIATETDLPKVQASAALDATIASIRKALKSGEEVKIAGLGTFKVAHRKATTGRNPRTGEEIQIAASNRVKFSSGKELKEAVNK